ncbi:hypothetical protein KI387_025980, partial [Taxus chinensis]
REPPNPLKEDEEFLNLKRKVVVNGPFSPITNLEGWGSSDIYLRCDADYRLEPAMLRRGLDEVKKRHFDRSL